MSMHIGYCAAALCMSIKRNVSAYLSSFALHPDLNIISKRHHADGLPDTQSYTRGNTTVEALDSILLVYERECVHDREFRRTVGIGSSFGHRLHLVVVHQDR